VKQLQRSECENLSDSGYGGLVDHAHDVLTNIAASAEMPITPSEAHWWATMDTKGRKVIALVLSSRSRFLRVAFTPDELKDPQARLEKVWADFGF
jgi:hypothetical protein